MASYMPVLFDLISAVDSYACRVAPLEEYGCATAMSTGMFTRPIRIIRSNEGCGVGRLLQMSTLRNIIGVIFCLSLIASPAWAQNGHTGNNRSQAVLTIQVNVAPIVISPQVQTAKAQATGISYDIPTDRARFSVTEKIQDKLVAGPSGQIQSQTVKIITVILD